uniref:Uncharacterized protein n=1 Tax=Strigamia maritima TaxID=126957 RepID=T1JN94_STRMM
MLLYTHLKRSLLLIYIYFVLCSANGDRDEESTHDLYRIEGKVFPTESLSVNDELSQTRILVNGGENLAFLRKDGSFMINNLKSGSYVVEIINSNFIYEPARVDINSKGKFRARKVNFIQSSQVVQIPYPLKFKARAPFKYFQVREQWRVTDFFFNPMVLMMVLPLVLIMILPKVMNAADPETQREMQQSLNMPRYDMPELSEVFTSFFTGMLNSIKSRPKMSLDNGEAQGDEILALDSIFDSNVFIAVDESGLKGGQFIANLQLSLPFHVICKLPDAETPPKAHEIEHLPPVIINFRLPLDYPSNAPPHFTLSCKWLSRDQLTFLCTQLDRIWEEHTGEVVLFHWFQFLIDECLQILGIKESIEVSLAAPIASKPRKDSAPQKSETQHEVDDNSSARCNKKKRHDEDGCDLPKKYFDPRAIQDLPPDTSLLTAILDYDQERRLQVFNSTFFLEKMGSQCLAFKTCNHVFCRSCLQSYFEVQINSGNLHKLNCPQNECTSQALHIQVRELVSPELFAKYDRMLLSCTLDTMADIVYCPRTLCQCAVLVEPDSTMANCPSCFFAFCILCKRAYHGVVPCRIKAGDFKILYEEYERSTDEEKRLMEKRYGRHQLQNVVQNVLSEDWVLSNSKRCPHCNTPIEKLDGCNKMTCVHCNCYFCWLCMTRLNKSDPYAHYNNSTSKCVNLLFQGVDYNSDDEADFGEFL